MNKLSVADKAAERRVSNTVREPGVSGVTLQTGRIETVTLLRFIYNPRPCDVVWMRRVQSRVSVWFKYIYFTKLRKTLMLLSYSPTSVGQVT